MAVPGVEPTLRAVLCNHQTNASAGSGPGPCRCARVDAQRTTRMTIAQPIAPARKRTPDTAVAERLSAPAAERIRNCSRNGSVDVGSNSPVPQSRMTAWRRTTCARRSRPPRKRSATRSCASACHFAEAVTPWPDDVTSIGADAAERRAGGQHGRWPSSRTLLSVNQRCSLWLRPAA